MMEEIKKFVLDIIQSEYSIENVDNIDEFNSVMDDAKDKTQFRR